VPLSNLVLPVALEELNGTLMLLSRCARTERAQIPSLSGARINFPRIQTVLTRPQLANHGTSCSASANTIPCGYRLAGSTLREVVMKIDPEKPPRNRDQELPRRQGESIESPQPAEDRQEGHERNAPVPEEETYERERRPR
jgi:hypothetical protein